MNQVKREEILDYETYEDQRDAERRRIMDVKRPRRIHVGDHLTFLFENTDTMRYQIQEMVRAERLVRESDIRHELDTYNALLPGPGGLACTLLIEIPDADERRRKLARWRDLLPTIYVELPDGRRIAPTWDPAQVGEEKLSSVQFLQFDTGGEVPVAVGSTHPDIDARVPLTDEQKAALAADLGVA